MTNEDLPSTAPPPFDQDSADIVLHTSDNVNYHVHSVILSQASPFFRTMFTLPQPLSEPIPNSAPDTCAASSRIDAGVPVIDIEEHSKTLETILRTCYPIVKTKKHPVDEIEPALRAAQKYEMDLPVDSLKDELRGATLGEPGDPFRVWAAACRMGFEDVAQHAARYLNMYQLDSLDETCLRGVTAGDYFRMREFCRCGGRFTATSRLLTPSRPSTTAPSSKRDLPRERAFCRTVPYSDVILRSVDGVEFPAHRCVLAMASPILRERLVTIPYSPTAEPVPPASTSPLPVLELPEIGDILSDLLDVCCYFHGEQGATSATDLVAVMVAAEKYGMAQGLTALHARWSSVAKDAPLEAYLAAASMDLADCAKLAATHVVGRPSTVCSKYDPGMETCPALAYHRLLDYYKACNNAVYAELRKVKEEYPCRSGRSPEPLECAPSAVWFVQQFLDGIARSEVDGPQGKAHMANSMLTEFVWQSVGRLIRPSWGEAPKLIQLSRSLPQRLESAIGAVELRI